MTSSGGECREAGDEGWAAAETARRLNTLGYRVGTRVLELMSWRAESSSKAPKREIRFLPALMSIHTSVWRTVFGKPADAIEKSVENADECERPPRPITPFISHLTLYPRHDH